MSTPGSQETKQGQEDGLTEGQLSGGRGSIRVQAVRGRLCMGIKDLVQCVKDQGGEEIVHVGKRVGRGGGSMEWGVLT